MKHDQIREEKNKKKRYKLSSKRSARSNLSFNNNNKLLKCLPSATEVFDKKASSPYCASVFTFSSSFLLSASALLVRVRSAMPQVWPASGGKRDGWGKARWGKYNGKDSVVCVVCQLLVLGEEYTTSLRCIWCIVYHACMLCGVL